jgi:hypothetical protein
MVEVNPRCSENLQFGLAPDGFAPMRGHGKRPNRPSQMPPLLSDALMTNAAVR